MRKMRVLRYLLGIVAAVIIISFLILSFDKIAVFVLSKFYNLQITYNSLSREKGGYSFTNLKLTNKKIGLGFYAARAELKSSWKNSFFKSLDIDFKFKDVHFIKLKTSDEKAKYNTLERIVAMPFEGRWMYKDLTGAIELFSNGITVKKFAADGRDIRIDMSGDVYYNNIVDIAITVFFSKNALKDIPPEMTGVVMNNEPNEWKSFSVKMKGDLNAPAMQITGKLFRLNVGTMVMKD